MTTIYEPRKELRPRRLTGISEEQISQHWTLYEGYVKNVNLLGGKLAALTEKGEFGPEFAELKRREGFEYDGMLLHEHYFGILKGGGTPLEPGSRLSRCLALCFGSFAAWRRQFAAVGMMRGSGWVILYHDPRRDALVNFWIESHEDGHPAGFAPIVVMDVWEHAYMVDGSAGGRSEYIEKFFLNVDWAKAENALRAAAPAEPVAAGGQ
ncbi:MAG: Fe-Mn family superoxide dismutase [Elusimicrobiota bacterium]|nr:Fe-Mn family superoxide dismutase [Elusimicrobiota bacterium]